MSLGEIPPWLNVSPRDFVAAGSAGAAAGESAARTALEAQSLSQRAAEEGARLSQAERLHAMDIQARQDISEQNRLREDQQLAIESAYKTAQIGLGKQKLQETQFLAEAKGRAAAEQFARETGFASYLKSNPGDVMGGVAKFGPAPALVNSLRMAQPPQRATVELQSDVPGKAKITQPSGHIQYVDLPHQGLTTTQEMTKKREIGKLNRDLASKQDDPDAVKRIQDEIRSWQDFGVGTNTPPPSTVKPLPLPAKKEDLVKGNPYDTKRGVATWDGEKFVQ